MIQAEKIYAKIDGMAILDGGEIQNIGFINSNEKLELKNGEIVRVSAVYFNLNANIKSTDIFLFDRKNMLLYHSFGTNTNKIYVGFYKKILAENDQIKLNDFINLFLFKYIPFKLMNAD